jgi:hypothetical protein
MPEKRPMDNMKLNGISPQEDEFALCNLGAPSPYEWLIFPREESFFLQSLKIDFLSPAERNQWQESLLYFYKKLTLRTQKRLLIKSPTHSFRIRLLRRIFPQAKFIYIKRDPYKIFMSSKHLWLTLSKTQSLQTVSPVTAERLVIKTFDLLHETIEEETRDIPPAHLIELDFESLIADPMANLKRIYSQLQLEGFVETREAFITYTREHQNYKKNSYEIRPEEINLLNNVWGKFIQEHDRFLQ